MVSKNAQNTVAVTANGAPMSLDDASFGYVAALLSRLMAQLLKARNGPNGLLPGQYPIALELLHRSGLTQAELCRCVRVEQGTMANTLRRMERDAFIARSPCPNDGRQSVIRLTSKGLALTRTAMGNVEEINRLALGAFDFETQAELRRMMVSVVERVDAALGLETSHLTRGGA
ncbi:hypothetical protein P775_15970 [Puniceibacterium antarcticum]|uniref:HTH marR-type domain-containing protein n=1 Tax=Puniceibacterium antarcticum TaxID=1206336 RepID=A0A2G8RCE2_9RHOB|nr:MarR family transcriptional regulator [Puniceibacterium antarcticum]PIL19163.1 hypothetical protein P775_15970 [Puniceibacterium antarcticum]